MNSIALLPNLAGPEGWIILVVVLLLFGGKKLPEVGRSIGASMREFTKGKNGEDETKP
jgi:sec-independent protein translocase protein TatA